MSFIDYYSELRGFFPKLDVFLAQKLVNRAWNDIQKKRLWSFLIQDSALLCPGIVSAGTADVTQYSDTVTVDATAAAAINLISIATPVTQQQFRLPGFPVYNILTWDGTNTIVLDRLYAEGSATGVPYNIYQCYYSVPNDLNFRKWLSVYDPINAYPLYLNKSSQDFDRWDPQRQSISMPYFLGYYKRTNGQALYELWPVPTENIGYRCKWLTAYQDFLNDADALPATISETMLMERAQFLACEWAEKMAGTYKELAGVNWPRAKADHWATYLKLERDAELEDEDTFQTNLIDNNDSDVTDGYPFTAAWYQSHDAMPGV